MRAVRDGPPPFDHNPWNAVAPWAVVTKPTPNRFPHSIARASVHSPSGQPRHTDEPASEFTQYAIQAGGNSVDAIVIHGRDSDTLSTAREVRCLDNDRSGRGVGRAFRPALREETIRLAHRGQRPVPLSLRAARAVRIGSLFGRCVHRRPRSRPYQIAVLRIGADAG
jgi:hypothetical protein